MASMNYVVHQLAEMGLSVDADGDFILCEDPGLDFERSHDGVRGISRWLAETREEYKMAAAKLFEEDQDEERAIEFAETQEAIEEEQRAYEEAAWQGIEPEEEFAPESPEKEHVVSSAQLALAKELNSPKEVAQAAEVDDQDRGGFTNPADYIRDMKLDAPAVVVLVKGQRFMAPEGWKIKETRGDKVLFYGSIYKGRKMNSQAAGSKFSLVRDL